MGTTLVYSHDSCCCPMAGALLLRDPDHVDHDHSQHTEGADEETAAPPSAEGNECDHTSEGTDDQRDRCKIDGPVPDTAGVGAFMQIVKFGEEATSLGFDRRGGICSIDCHHCAFP